MKKINLFYAIIFTLFFTGCSIKNFVPNNLSKSQFKQTEEKFEDMDKLECSKLNSKKIYLNYTTKQTGTYMELFDGSDNVDIEYKGNYGTDFQNFLSNILVKYCGSIIVNNKNESDISITGNINKYFTQVIKFDNNTEEKTAHAEVKSILEVDAIINGKEFLFGHVLNSKKDTEVDGPYLNISSELKYNDYQSSFAILAFSMKFGFVPELSGIVKKYDIEGNEIKKINLSGSDIGIIMNNESKQDIMNLYDTAGMLKLLMYRYAKDITVFINENI